MRERFGTKVSLRYKKGKGAIDIRFFSDDELERILQILKEYGQVPTSAVREFAPLADLGGLWGDDKRGVHREGHGAGLSPPGAGRQPPGAGRLNSRVDLHRLVPLPGRVVAKNAWVGDLHTSSAWSPRYALAVRWFLPNRRNRSTRPIPNA